MAGPRRRKFYLYGWVDISAIGEIWLTHNAASQGTLDKGWVGEGTRRSKDREKVYA